MNKRVHGAPFHSNLHANLQRRLTLLNLCSPKAYHLDHQHLPYMGKIITLLLAHQHRYGLPPSSGVLHGLGHVARGQAKCVGSAGHISLGMPRIGAWDERDPHPVTRTGQDGGRGAV